MKFSKISAGDSVTSSLVTRISEYSDLLRNHVEFYTDSGDSSVSRKENDGLGAGTRQLDQAYTPEIVKPVYFPTYRKLMGKAIRLDVAREKMGYDIPSEMASHVRRIAPGIAGIFNNTFVNGNTDTNTDEFNGIKKLVTTNQKLKLGTNGTVIPTGNKEEAIKAKQEWLEALDEVVGMCKGTRKVIVTNGKIKARLNTIAREYINYTIDSFGKSIQRYIF